MYLDTKKFVHRCRQCQLQGNISARNAMPLHFNLQVEIFDVWGIDFMGPFKKLGDCEHILVAVDYISKWVEALSCRAANAKHARKMFHEIIFPRFGTPRMVISDRASHFIDKSFRTFLQDLGTRHNVFLTKKILWGRSPQCRPFVFKIKEDSTGAYKGKLTKSI